MSRMVHQDGAGWNSRGGRFFAPKTMIIFCARRSEMLDTIVLNVVKLKDVVKELRLYRKGNQDE